MSNDFSSLEEDVPAPSSKALTLFKSIAACTLLYSAVSTYNNNNISNDAFPRRQLTLVGDDVPSYMDSLMKDLRERKKLFDDTPPEEVKYWFEYSGSLQVSRFLMSSI
jgi:hypothetical protein